jgi:hypothetical protein
MESFGWSTTRSITPSVLQPNIQAGLRAVLRDDALETVQADLVPLPETMMYELAAAVTRIDVGDDPAAVQHFISLQERFAHVPSITIAGPVRRSACG